MASTTHPVHLSSDRRVSVPSYNISGSCLWTLVTLVPLLVLLLLLAF